MDNNPINIYFRSDRQSMTNTIIIIYTVYQERIFIFDAKK